MAQRIERNQAPQAEGLSKRVESEFPTDPQERLGALLASFNIGPKATTFLLLPENGYISPGDLARGFRETVSGTGMAETDKITAPNYCYQALCPIGLVAKEYSIDYFGVEKLVGFGKTSAGQWYGTAAAALVLDFELRHQKSLFPIFGSTNTTSAKGERAPLTRARILELLFSQTAPVRKADILRELGRIRHNSLGGVVLRALKTAGVIDYEAVTVHTGKIQVTYTLGNLSREEIRPDRYSVALTGDVAAICSQLTAADLAISQAAVFERLPEEVKKRWRPEVLRHRISGILSDLARQKFLARGKYKGRDIQSTTWITDWGRVIVTDLLRPLWGLVTDDEQVGQKLREVIPQVRANFLQYAQNSAELYYPFSNSFKRKQRLENLESIKDLLVDGAKTTVDVAELFGLSKGGIEKYLAALMEAGEVKRQRVKGVYYYTVV